MPCCWAALRWRESHSSAQVQMNFLREETDSLGAIDGSFGGGQGRIYRPGGGLLKHVVSRDIRDTQREEGEGACRPRC